MKIEQIKTILQNKIDNLKAQQNQAEQVGDLERYVILDAELKETEETLRQING
jgi:hypothetical protein